MPRDITGSYVRNIFTLRQLENGLNREGKARLARLFNDIKAELARHDPTIFARPATRARHLDALLTEISSIIGPQFDQYRKWLRTELAAIGKQQAAWAGTTIGRAVGENIALGIGAGAGINVFKALIDTDPIHGKLLTDWVSDLSDATQSGIAQQLRIGIAQSETLPQLIRRVMGTARGEGRYFGGERQKALRHAEGIARTSVNHIANSAHLDTYRQNEDILTGVEWTAAFDSRTCVICAGLDSRVWQLDDESLQRPPAHPQCRCILVPVVDWEGLGLEKPPEGTRQTADGQVGGDTTYSQWLKDQNKTTQDKVLGKAKAQLFRDGKVDLRGLVTRENRILTVAELGGRAAPKAKPRLTNPIGEAKTLAEAYAHADRTGATRITHTNPAAVLDAMEDATRQSFEARGEVFDAARFRENWSKHIAVWEKAGVLDVPEDYLILLQNAANMNAGSTTYGRALQKWGDDVVLALRADYPKGPFSDAEGVLTLPRALDEHLGVRGSAAAQSGGTYTQYWYRGHKMYDQTLNNRMPLPGASVTSEWGGASANLRHEYGHRVWKRVAPARRQEWSALWREAAGGDRLAFRDLFTYYGGTVDTEGFPEVFATVTSEFFDRTAYPPRAQPLIDFMLGLVK